MNLLPRRTLLSTAAAALGLATLGGPRDAHAEAAGFQFEVYKDSRGGFRWRFKAGNGVIICAAERPYTTRKDCLNSIDLIKQGAARAPIEDLT